jgi:hypothetical protein
MHSAPLAKKKDAGDLNQKRQEELFFPSSTIFSNLWKSFFSEFQRAARRNRSDRQGFHVGGVDIGRHVQQGGEELVAEGVPEIQHSGWPI